MTRYLSVAVDLAHEVRSGALGPAAELSSVREHARGIGVAASTVTRAYRHLAAAGVIVLVDRRPPRVAADGAVAAARLLEPDRVFRLAASDDPALALLLDHVGHGIAVTGVRGSFQALRSVSRGEADGAAIHLRDRTGAYNDPFATALLRDQDPHLIHLWRREQGFLVPRGGAGSVATPADLSGLRVARRETGAGTRVLLDQLLLGAGIAPESVPGPELASHLECGLAVAAGIADVALGLRSAARDLDLEFVSVGWEPYEVVVPAVTLPAALRLLDGLAVPALRAGIEALGGYDLADAATVRRLAPG